MSLILLRLNLVAAVLVGSGSLLADEALADCGTNGSSGVDAVLVEAQCGSPANSNSEDPPTSATSDSAPAYVEYLWSSVCTPFDPNRTRSQPVDCSAARVCPDASDRVWQLWGRRPPPDGGWDLITSQCFGRPPTAADTPRPTVTPALVLNALRRIGLPSLEAHTQPEGKTLVNFDTIFYTEAQPFTRTLTLLGQRVEVEATPVSYTWHYGDGSTRQTDGPGAPYPSKEITYRYHDAHVTVSASVDVTYGARFRVNGGAWQGIPQQVTVAGPETDLRVSEATAVLSGSYG